MRLWHYELLPYLPELQFKGQLRELVAIMHDWRDRVETNHLLINRVMEYERGELVSYFLSYRSEYFKRYSSTLKKYEDEFIAFDDCLPFYKQLYKDWHNKEYLRVCMANLYEKHFYGVEKSRITDEEWQTLLDGYKQITNEDYVI